MKYEPVIGILQKKRVQCLVEHSTSHQLIWHVDAFVFCKPLLFKAAELYCECKDDRSQDDKPTQYYNIKAKTDQFNR